MSKGNFYFPSTSGGSGGGGGAVDAEDVTYATNASADWPGADPTDVEEALDTAAGRLAEMERFAPIFLTGATAEIDASDAADLDIALPAGVSRCVILWAAIERTAGAAGSVRVILYANDARSVYPRYIFGSAFSGRPFDQNPLSGPMEESGGNGLFYTHNYTNIEGDAFLRFVVNNQDFFEEAGTFRLDLIVLPLPTVSGES